MLMWVIYPFEIFENNVIAPLSASTGLSEDRIRYVLLLFVAIPLGFCMRYVLHPLRVGGTTRHCYSLACGLIFGLMCFGSLQMMYLFSSVGICYLFLFTLPPKVVHIYTMVWMLACISVAHAYRLITDYGGYHLDFTGPLMIIVQRTTYVAFALHDGMARESAQLNEDQRKQQLNQRPSLLAYLSYNFCFMCFLAGPACTYKEYQDFITGSNFATAKLKTVDQFPLAKEHTKEPSNMIIVLLKTLVAIFFLIVHIVLDSWFPLEIVLVPDMNIFTRVVVGCIISYPTRAKFFYIWLIMDSACNAGGLGFSGYDKLGNAKWDLVSAVDIFAIEFGTNVRARVNGWNITTARWLRRVCYERVEFVNPVLATFILSAWWHGFYPGNYYFFGIVSLYILAARKLRRFLRHHFQFHLAAKWGYDVLTWAVTHTLLSLISLCTVTMHLDVTTRYLSYLYFIPAVAPVMVILLPIGQKSWQQISEPANIKEKQSEVVPNKNKTE